MADDYQGIPLKGEPSGCIMVPENIPHYYDENGDLKVIAVGYFSNGTLPPDPPAENKAPGFHRAGALNTDEPQAKFGSDGICTASGWTPGGVWYNAGDQTEHPSGNTPAQGAALVAALSVVQFLRGE